MKKSLDMCRGCRDDFYNDKNPYGVKRCWLFKDARVVTRWSIATWTMPTQPGAFTEVVVLNCRHGDGLHYADKLPPHAIDPVRLRAVGTTKEPA